MGVRFQFRVVVQISAAKFSLNEECLDGLFTSLSGRVRAVCQAIVDRNSCEWLRSLVNDQTS